MSETVFDYLTIFPPSKENYVSPWVANNCTILIRKFMFNEIYCRNIDTIPRIDDSNYRFIVVSLLKDSVFPTSLPHVKIEESPKFTLSQRVYRRFFFTKEQKEKEFWEWNTKSQESFLLNFQKDAALYPLIAEWNRSPHAINYLSCDFEIARQTETSKSDYIGDMGFLRLGSFRKKYDTVELCSFRDDAKPERKVLDSIAILKMKEYSPSQLGDFLTFHRENCPYSIYYFLEMINHYAEIMYFESMTTQSINYQLVFKEWLNDTIKSKQLDYQKFSDSVKEKIKTSQPEPKQTTTPELIKLNYGANNEKIIQLLHVELNGIFIENIDFKDFERHFKDNGAELKKMQWKGIETEITYLINELKLENRYKLIMIVNHFYDQTNNKDFKNKQLSTVLSQDVDTRKMKSNPIYKILNSINLEVSKVST